LLWSIRRRLNNWVKTPLQNSREEIILALLQVQIIEKIYKMGFHYPDSGNLNFSFKSLYAGVIITIFITVVFLVIADEVQLKFEIRDIVSILTCGIVSTTLIYHAKNLKLNFDANNERLIFDKWKFEKEIEYKKMEGEYKKKAYSFEVSTVWFKPEMAKNVEICRDFLLKEKGTLMNGTIQSFIKQLDENLDKRKAVICVLNYFENLSLMIRYDIVHEEHIKQCFKTVFLDYFKVLKRYIEVVQKTSGRYLMNYEEIAKRWDRD
jgi:hypothetical protein